MSVDVVPVDVLYIVVGAVRIVDVFDEPVSAVVDFVVDVRVDADDAHVYSFAGI